MNVFDCFETKRDISPIQRTLLASLTHEPAINNRYFLKWLSAVDFEALDYSSFRLIPAVFERFREVKEENPYYGRMKGIYRYHSVLNSMLLATGRSIFKKLIDAKIEFILFKGAALILKYYKNHAIRPMGDIDFLIHEKDILRAEKILLEHNLSYRYEAARRKAFNEHSLDYVDANNNGYDLHRYALYESLVPGIDSGIWQRAMPLLWNGLEVKVMAPEDLIFTGCVNGVRDLSMRFEWINDIIKIIHSEPSLSWDIIYREAKNRNLCEQLFNALYTINSIAPRAVPVTRLNDFLAKNKKYKQNLLASLSAEGRTYGINQNESSLIRKVQSKWARRRFFKKKNNEKLHALQHIRYFFDEEQQINLLYLHYKHLPALNYLFDIEHPELFTTLLQKYPTTGEGYLKLEPGMLRLKSNFQLPQYQASLEVLDTHHGLSLFSAEKKIIQLKLQNHSEYLWLIPNQSSIKYGVSYHLYAEDGTLINWEFPRNYFLEPKKNYITFMGTQVLDVALEIQAPLESGNYKLYLDIVHEGITWFSQQGNKFPVLDINVISSEEVP